MLRAHCIVYRTSLHVLAHVAHMFQADNQSRVEDPVQVGCVITDLHRSQAGSVTVYRIERSRTIVHDNVIVCMRLRFEHRSLTAAGGFGCPAGGPRVPRGGRRAGPKVYRRSPMWHVRVSISACRYRSIDELFDVHIDILECAMTMS